MLSAGRFRFGLLAFTLAAPAYAEKPTPVTLDYQAYAGCPVEPDFFRELSARTHLVRRAEPGDEAEPVRVRIEQVPGGSHGELTLGAGEGGSKREVSAAQCEQVVAALALMTALAIDPDAITSSELPPPPAPASRPEPPAAQPPRVRATAPSARTRWNAGVALELLGSVSPDPTPSVRPFLGVDRERAGAFGFGVRFSAGRARGQVTRADGAADFTLVSARLEGCPLHVPLALPLWLSACAAFDAGELSAAGRDVTPAKQLDRPWLAGGATGRIELRPIGPLGVELSGDLLFPLLRDRFFVQADSTVRRTPAILAGGALGVSVRFP